MHRLLLLVPVVTACGYQIPETPEEMLADMTDWRCTARERCFGSRTANAIQRSVGLPEITRSTCTAKAFGPRGRNSLLLGALKAERVTIDARAMLDCRVAWRNVSCAQLGYSEPYVCDDVFVGSTAPAEGCLIDEECVDGNGIGSCTGNDEQCGVCEQSRRPRRPGEHCASTSGCASGLWCEQQSATCTARPDDDVGLGEDCWLDDEWSWPNPMGSCREEDNLLCVDGTCQSALFSNIAGEACGGRILCDRGLVCPTNGEGMGGTCQQPAGVGEACIIRIGDESQQVECADGLFCYDEVCTPVSADGEPCRRWGHGCASGYCDEEGNLCAAKPMPVPWQDCR